ncbi:putative glycosylhydrolase family 13-2 [Colletotrichum sublineola]|uniref:alpha-amylase n=1 Tax=Colletotrichum sublineola TaxID=1173701 RepID=A0A066XTD5_COLSU|nr:putative glycosylhydrolase family 13-2 [Colletotrichum sublineola]
MKLTARSWVTGAVALWASAAQALDAEGWKLQSIYQVMTDRFALAAVNDEPYLPRSCNVSAQTYCGGTWKGIESQLDYIQGMGFTAIWISPIVAQVEAPVADGGIAVEAYHGYWARDIYALNRRFGTKQDLEDLIKAVHARGMYFMLDVAPNHMGPQPGQVEIMLPASNATKNSTKTATGATYALRKPLNYSIYSPFNSSRFFHPYCRIDYTDTTSKQTCWEGWSEETGAAFTLPDLRTEDDDVLRIYVNWIRTLVAEYSIDGLRIDAARHVQPSFLTALQASAGVFSIGEFSEGDVAPYVGFLDAIDGAFNFPQYYARIDMFQSAFTANSTTATPANFASQMAALQVALPNRTATLGSFYDSHDAKRFASVSGDMAKGKNAMVLAMLVDGIPVVYQGAEQRFSAGQNPYYRAPLFNSPLHAQYRTDSDMYKFIRQLNRFRSWVVAHEQNGTRSSFIQDQARVVFNDSHNLAFTKAEVIAVATNLGLASDPYNLTLPAPSLSNSIPSPGSIGFPPLTDYIDIVSCTQFKTNKDGKLSFQLIRGYPRVFYPAAKLTNSGLCSTVLDEKTEAHAHGKDTCVVTFEMEVATSFGEVVYLLGGAPQLGSGDMLQALALDSSLYMTERPLWTVAAELALGSTVTYGLLKVSANSGEELSRWMPGNNTVVVDAGACGKAGGRLVVRTSWKTNGTIIAGSIRR